MKSYEKLVQDLAPKEFGKKGMIWIGFLVTIIVAALFAYYQQIDKGLSITHLNDYVLWGVYISNFVFFVAISLVGSLVTAILRLSGAKWSTPLTRISEVIAVAAIVMAGLTIIVEYTISFYTVDYSHLLYGMF
jgi:molybdopterin-containing oxidoreductase family membrane subunit